jgi:hypothetical protein
MDSSAPASLTPAEAIAPVLAEAATLGLDFRPINGLVAKRAKRLGIDLDEIGRASQSTLSDEDYDDQIKRAAWLICAPEEEIAAAIDAGIGPKACEAWQARHLPTLRHEKAVYTALMARWLEYQVELETVFGPGSAPAAPADQA